jgi:2-hydroxychromene-2-carboxylate isomerase
MPMMMRGIPAPFAKQQYIITESAREARFYGDAFGPFCDPFGEPVKRAFAAFHHAVSQDLGLEFVTEYLDAAWAEGLDITTDAGLAEVCERVGVRASEVDFNSGWMAVLEDNLAAMAQGSLWGVPSFRVTGGGQPPFACWGQDRIWRVAAELKNRSEGS